MYNPVYNRFVFKLFKNIGFFGFDPVGYIVVCSKHFYIQLKNILKSDI